MAYSQLRNGNNHYQESESEVVVTTSSQPSRKEESKRLQHQKKLFIFAVIEFVLGIICVVLGATIVGLIEYRDYTYNYTYTDSYDGRVSYYTDYVYLFTTGEGMWCGAWIIAAGALGFFCAKKNVSKCMLICNMSFSIVGALFAGIMLVIGVNGALAGGRLERKTSIVHVLVLYCVLCVCALISMILLIFSSAYSCRLMGCCKKDSNGCCPQGDSCCPQGDSCCPQGNSCCPQGYSCCLPYPNYNSAYGGQVVFTQQPQIGGIGVMVPQQQGFAGQQIMYAGQPAMMYQQQPAVGNQGSTYSQQATMPFQGAQNVQPGYVVQASQPAATTAGQGPQPVFQQGSNVIHPPTIQPNQQVLVNPNPQEPVSGAASTQQAAGAVYATVS